MTRVSGSSIKASWTLRVPVRASRSLIEIVTALGADARGCPLRVDDFCDILSFPGGAVFFCSGPRRLPLMPSYQTIFFVISLVCAVPVLFWYYRRHSHPRFRPQVGEMVMVTLFAGLLSLGGSLLIGGMMDDPEQFRPGASMGSIPMPSAQGGADEGMDSSEDDRKDSKKSESGSRKGSGEDSGSRR